MSRRVLERICSVLILVAIGTAGVLLGGTIGDRKTPATFADLSTGLLVGDLLPNVRLVDTVGQVVLARDLAKRQGVVAVFIDPECPACTEAASRWQKLIDAGSLLSGQVVGITTASLEAIESYRTRNRLSFPIYRDLEWQFRNAYQVNLSPYEVIVGVSGVIRSTNVDTHLRLDARDVRRKLAL